MERAQTQLLAGLNREQKTIFGLLVFFAICVLGLGVLQIRHTMLAPFALSNALPVNIKSQVNSVDTLRYRDTDQDGLSDFDELYVYGTSPYLFDTFSYGFSDKEVIAKGLPLCPKGQNCNDVGTSDTAVLNANASSTVLGGAEAALGAAPEDLSAIINDPKKIRVLLIQYGIKPEVLAGVNDRDLMSMVEETVAASSTLMNARIGGN